VQLREAIRARKGTGKEIREELILRIRVTDERGAWRSAVWHDDELNIVWLCRCLRISDYSSEDSLYEAYADMYVRDPENIPLL
jgi:hypothetical protein